MSTPKQSLFTTIAAKASPDAIRSACQNLEAQNPTSSPTATPDLLCKTWCIDWTTLDLPPTTTIQRLAFNRFKYLPEPLHVKRVMQVVRPTDAIYSNVVEGVLRTDTAEHPVAVTVHGRYEVIDAVRLNITFSRATISLLDGGDAAAWQERVGGELNGDGYLEAALRFTGWSDTTYLDDDTRVARGMAHNIYVLSAVDVPWAIDVAQEQRN